MEKEVGDRMHRLNELTVIKNNTFSADVAFFFFFNITIFPLTQRISLIQETAYGSALSCHTKEEIRMKT